MVEFMVSIYELVSREKSFDILNELLSYGELTVSELLKKIGGSASTITRRINELIEAGLILERSSKKWPYKRLLRLTDYGKRIAKRLRSLKLDEKSIIERSPARWILLLAYLNNGIFESVTRLVKFLFLLREEYDLKVDYDFVWYKYGPFSKDILMDLDAMETYDFLTIDQELLGYDSEGGEPVVRKTIRLTKKGEELARELLFNTPQGYVDILKKILEKYYKMPLKNLKDYVYSRYSEKKSSF